MASAGRLKMPKADDLGRRNNSLLRTIGVSAEKIWSDLELSRAYSTRLR
jgi:hypothetical protein